MRTVGLKILKKKLSEYVRLVSGGETVLVTRRDVVVAELRPPGTRGPSVADAVLAEAMRRGWLTAPVTGGSTVPPRLSVAPIPVLLQELDTDRGNR
ncbi:MAG: prevent-host-death protein [Phycisphaerae bacterium]|nr:prevent-host-death protein [Gemmatimonadaceae bacterium]